MKCAPLRHSLPMWATAALSLGVACVTVPSAARAQDRNDIVPRGDIAYDLLGSLADAGRLPGFTLADFARGDRLYTRAELARILAQADIVSLSDTRFAVSTRILREEFAPELFGVDPKRYSLDPKASARSGAVGGRLKARVLTGPAGGGGIARVFGAIPFGRDGYAAVSLGNWRDEWYNRHRLTPPGHYDGFETAYAHVNGRALNVTVGRLPLRWGAGYSGTLLISDDGPSIPQIAVDKSFVISGRIGHRIGRLNFSESVGEFHEANVSNTFSDATGTRRYFVGRRLVAHGGPWGFSIAEAMKSTRLPDPEWATVLPLYLYQNDWTAGRKKHYIPFLATTHEPNTFWKNYQGNAGISFQADRRNGLLLYGELLIDDFKSPKGVGNGFNTPQKLGEQIGIYVPHFGGENGPISARVEYTSVDPLTYTNDSVPVAWTNNGASLGYPTGPNARVLFGRVDARVSSKVRVAVEAETRRDRGPVLPGFVSARLQRTGAYATYALSRNAFTGLRFEHAGASAKAPGRGASNRLEANAGIGF